MIRLELDWGASREYVEQAEPMKEVVESIQNDLQDYVNKSGMDTVKQYLSTHYFDQTGYRYSSFLEDIQSGSGMFIASKFLCDYSQKEYPLCGPALDIMHRITAAKIAQERIFGEIEANNAFEQWVVGDHDT